MFDLLFELIVWLNGYFWSPATFLLLMLSGVIFSVWTKFIQYRSLTHGFRILRGDYDDSGDPGAISPFQALSASLSGTVGLGNIGGVALAIAAGGPGALFWMWVIGFLGMALKTIEITQAMMFRNVDNPGDPQGGAMWVIHRSLQSRGGVFGFGAKLLAVLFSLATILSSVSGGNMFQAWNVAGLTERYFGIPKLGAGIALAAIVALVILGGVKRIGTVAGKLVPLMCGLYLLVIFAVLGSHLSEIPPLLAEVVRSAFETAQPAGAFLGGATGWIFSVGLRRALFSNEAGQGSGPIAHAAAKTREPARQGVLGGLGPFIDTLCVCTLTALLILITGVWNRDAIGEFQGPISITPVVTSLSGPTSGDSAAPGSVFQVNAPATASSLPRLPGGSSWTAGSRFFLIAEVAGGQNNNTGTNLIRVSGQVLASPGAAPRQAAGASSGISGGHIEWDRIELDPSEWTQPPRQVALRDARVYQTFDGASLTAYALDQEFDGAGKWVVSFAAWLFAISTIITWSYYGEQGIVFTLGRRAILPYRWIYIACVVLGAVAVSDTARMEALIDIGTGAMLCANMPIVLILGRRAVEEINGYFRRLQAGEFATKR